MKNPRQAFTLLEVLISLSLFSILLGVVASLMRDTSTLMREAADDRMAGVLSALDTVSSDVRAAYSVIQCDHVAVEILRIDAANSARLPNHLPTAGVFLLHSGAATTRIRYYQSGNSLSYQATYSDGGTEDLLVAENITGFGATLVNPGLMELSASSQDNTSNPVKVISLKTRVVLHLPKVVVP